MNNQTFLKLKELVEVAGLLGYDLLLENRINLIAYNKEGRAKTIRFYNYEETDIKQLEKRLEDIASKHRQKWEPEFMRLLPSITVLGWTVEFDALSVTLRDNDCSSCAFIYDEIGFSEMSELLADALLEQYAANLTESGSDGSDSVTCKRYAKQCGTFCKGNCDGCQPATDTLETDQGTTASCPDSNNCQDCDNDHCSQNPNAALLIWNKLDQDQQNLISCSLSSEDRETLFAALGLANS